MFFNGFIRKNPATGNFESYYRLVEAYRNENNHIKQRSILVVGFLPEGLTIAKLKTISDFLEDRYYRRHNLLEDLETDSVVLEYTELFWKRIVEKHQLNTGGHARVTRLVNMDTLRHNNVREIGTEAMCYHAWQQLGLSEFLETQGFSAAQAAMAATQVVSRAAYPASELRTSKWIQQNSAVCDLTGVDAATVTKDKLYRSALRLYDVHEPLEQHLSTRTNELFDLEDKILLYDLTNTYFEGQQKDSTLAKHGRSKEKRTDARLVVLALVTNAEGFIKYSALHEGNLADCKSLAAMIEKLSSHTKNPNAVIVLDAGIATEENLAMIVGKGYKYLCVSRTKLKDYVPVAGTEPVMWETKSKKNIRLKAVCAAGKTDYYLEVKSDAKADKERAMACQFELRFEQELEKIKVAIASKGGVKKIDKVNQRIGRAKEKYSSVQRYYTLELSKSDDGETATDLTWNKGEVSVAEAREGCYGVYFLRTNMALDTEGVMWQVYNTIREIENTFRTLKTDLDLRPVYHKKDEGTKAHLHLGLLAYWLVNTIRHQLKCGGVKHCWTEIIRIGNTQKVVETTGTNVRGEELTVKKCSEPTKDLKTLLDILKIKDRPFAKIKSVMHKPELKKIETQRIRELEPN